MLNKELEGSFPRQRLKLAKEVIKEKFYNFEKILDDRESKDGKKEFLLLLLTTVRVFYSPRSFKSACVSLIICCHFLRSWTSRSRVRRSSIDVWCVSRDAMVAFFLPVS